MTHFGIAPEADTVSALRSIFSRNVEMMDRIIRGLWGVIRTSTNNQQA